MIGGALGSFIFSPPSFTGRLFFICFCFIVFSCFLNLAYLLSGIIKSSLILIHHFNFTRLVFASSFASHLVFPIEQILHFFFFVPIGRSLPHSLHLGFVTMLITPFRFPSRPNLRICLVCFFVLWLVVLVRSHRFVCVRLFCVVSSLFHLFISCVFFLF